jgi:4-amino-4-deoxy-L-arabinose transferase-like glycosyltransferase
MTSGRERTGLAATLWNGPPRPPDGIALFLFALALRAVVVAWGAERFPPVDDGRFYDIVAGRIAQGLGYTWLWPDGTVTYAAHYPVGYPALIGGLYAIFGAAPVAAMALNAVVGAWGTWAVHRVASDMGRRGPALLAGLVAALHPGFLFYTPALMTEGVTAALLAVLAAWAVIARERSGRRRLAWLLAIGVLSGVVALIRPQTVVLAPVYGAFAAGRGLKARLGGAALASAIALLACAPWTLRNCARFDRCVFVSANGGWNLLIGSAAKATGRWVPIDELGVPEECRTIFGEADKDRCFGEAAVRNVREEPLRFIGLVPKKLAATFDWWGAPGHYLNASNGGVVDSRTKIGLGVAGALVERLVVLFALLGIGRAGGPRRLARALVALLGIGWLFHEHAWVAYVLLVVGGALAGVRQLAQRPGLAFGVSVVAATALTHAVFFGDGRYGLVTGLVLVALGAEAFHPQNGTLREVLSTALRRARR